MAIDWKRVKRDFEATGDGFPELGLRHKCSPETVRKRAGQERWKRPDAAGCARRQGKKGAGRVRKPGRPVDITEDHRKLWKGVKKRLVRGLKNVDLKLGLEELKVAKVAGEVLTSVIKGEREVWGMEGAAGERLPDDTDEIVREMESVTVPRGADEALDGE